MGFAIFVIPVAAAGIFGASEYLTCKSSKWDVLSQKYRLTGAQPSAWRGCRFLQLEFQAGNTLKRTSYSHGIARFSTNIWAHLFPKAFVASSHAGLYIKRQPWNFLHPAILIPWTRVSSVKTNSGTEHVTELVGRQTGLPGQQFRNNIPAAVAGLANAFAGDVVEIRLADPNIRIWFPANAAGNLEQYVSSKPATPAKPSPLPVGAP